MSLLDSDSEAIKKIQTDKDTVKKTSRRKKRFASLNRYSKFEDNVRVKDAKKAKKITPRPEPRVDIKTELPTIDTSEPEIQKQMTSSEVTTSLPDPVQEKSQNIVTETSNEAEKVFQAAKIDDASKSEKDNNSITKEITLSESNGNNAGNLKETTREQKENNIVATKVTKEEPIREQRENVTLSVRMLTGQKLALLNIFFQQLKRFGSLEPVRFTREGLATTSGMASGTVATVLNRLVSDGYVIRGKGKKGKGGWISITIPKPIYEQMITLESNNFNDRMAFSQDNNRVTYGVTTKVTNTPSSSSNLNINNTTITNSINEEWKIIQIPTILKEQGIAMAHIFQVARDGIMSIEDVQNSLDALAFDLTHDKVQPTHGALRFLMGTLRKQKTPYVSQSFIESEKKQMEDYLRMKQELEEAKKYKKEMALMSKFDEWWNTLTQEQKNKISEPSNYVPEGSEMQMKIARGKYLENPDIAIS